MVQLADEKRLYLGAAPETFLGSCVQTVRKAIDDGLIGAVTSFHICANRNTDVLASIFKFLRMSGGGICFDYGVYYLTALISLLGPIEKVFAMKNNRKTVRTNIFPQSPEYGEQYLYENETQIAAVLQLENGVTGNFALDAESNLKDLGVFMIYGTKGVLKLGDANMFGDPVTYIPNDLNPENWDKDTSNVLKNVSELSENCRGIGPAEMAQATQLGRNNRANKEFSYHVLDTVCQIMKSCETGMMEAIESTCERPEALLDWEKLLN